MIVRADQFDASLIKAKRDGLAPVYCISGDVPLLVQEAADQVRAIARQAGCHERVVLEADRSFDWQGLSQSSNSMSLFAEQRLIELRLPSGKPGDAGSKALQAYCQGVVSGQSDGDVLLLVTGKIEKASFKTKWFKALEKVGVIVQFWPLRGQQLQDWIERRLLSQGLRADPKAVHILATSSEGNLLACAQDIDKLRLLCDGDYLDTDAVTDAVVTSARYDVFLLVDAALLGNAARSSQILAGLRAEGTDATVVLWALAREIRALLSLVMVVQNGQPLSAELSRLRVWDNRKYMVESAVRRLSMPAVRAMLARAARLDRVIKGRETGNVWDELLQLSLMMAGVRPLKMVS